MLITGLRAAFLRRSEEREQALVEYALILALVSVAAIVILGTLGTNVDNIVSSVANAF